MELTGLLVLLLAGLPRLDPGVLSRSFSNPNSSGNADANNAVVMVSKFSLFASNDPRGGKHTSTSSNSKMNANLNRDINNVIVDLVYYNNVLCAVQLLLLLL